MVDRARALVHVREVVTVVIHAAEHVFHAALGGVVVALCRIGSGWSNRAGRRVLRECKRRSERWSEHEAGNQQPRATSRSHARASLKSTIHRLNGEWAG